MLLERQERIGFKPEEALILLEHRNLKNKCNRYLKDFIDFINFMEKIEINDIVNMSAIRRLVKVYNDTDDIMKFIHKVVFWFEPNVDKAVALHKKGLTKEMFNKTQNSNRPLFSEETTRKILSHMNEETATSATTSGEGEF